MYVVHIGQRVSPTTHLSKLVHSRKVVQPGFDVEGGQSLVVLPGSTGVFREAEVPWSGAIDKSEFRMKE